MAVRCPAHAVDFVNCYARDTFFSSTCTKPRFWPEIPLGELTTPVGWGRNNPSYFPPLPPRVFLRIKHWVGWTTVTDCERVQCACGADGQTDRRGYALICSVVEQ